MKPEVDQTSFKNTIKYLIISGLILSNALLLYGVCWILKDVHYMNTAQITLWLTWIALFFLMLAIGTLVKELCKFMILFIKKFNDLRK
ncbi:MAG: hypothetical protein ACLRVU_05335 [Beduini sp.]|uniref:hypothetical protein n=1 Tax=Beduini sp. TaxID=1922300 RepID=UPI0039A3CA8F